MKVNMPVTNKEVFMTKGKPIISKTNLKGQITAINRTFLEISGFTKPELINKQHHIVRHPDMPSEVFSDLWSMLKKEKPWKGIVKNRVKNGDYYWVYAQVTPVKTKGQVSEYMSVRRIPSKQQINDTEELYTELNSNRIPSISIIKRIVTFLGNSNISSKFLMIMIGLSAFWGLSQMLLDGLVSSLVTFAVTGIVLYTFIQRVAINPLKSYKKLIDLIAEGKFDNDIDISRNDEIGELYQSIQSMQLILDYNMEEANFKAEDAVRIKNALQVCDTSVMMADNDMNIIYANNAVNAMMVEAEDDLRKVLPEFSANELIGTNVDVFHKEPQRIRDMIATLTDPYLAQICVAGHTFSLLATPVFSDSYERLGTVIEWKNRTEELDIQQEIDTLVSAAVDGDLSQRIDISNKSGFFKVLAKGLNDLVEISDNVISEILTVLEAMSYGDLTKSFKGNYKGDFAKLQSDTNIAVRKLTVIITEIRASAASVSSGVREISGGNLDLSQRTEEQASALEETAASMEEMTASVRQNAVNAKNASDLAIEAQYTAESGGEVVGRAVAAMDEIYDSSNKISDIISVIDEIAFQTNLLALNAAVEAARAGEQGRGFAVVAAEVRNLAKRSASAAKEIKELIRDSVGKVEDGSNLVNESGTTLNQIVLAVQQVSKIINEISSSAQQQSDGIDQVNTAVSQMDETTQQNAALVEEASAASENMAEQASLVNDLMGFFTTDESNLNHVIHSSKKTAQHTDTTNTANSTEISNDVNEDGWEEF